jgi:uncharacterized membrane protein YbaN (DUF454 family)
MISHQGHQRKYTNKGIRYLLIILGTISLTLGIIGIVLPLLPTTPFLLLAVTCYARSSDKFYNWLLTNRWFGNYLTNYYKGNGIPVQAKILTITILWITIIISIVLINIYWVTLGLLLIAVIVTLHISFINSYKTKKN